MSSVPFPLPLSVRDLSVESLVPTPMLLLTNIMVRSLARLGVRKLGVLIILKPHCLGDQEKVA